MNIMLPMLASVLLLCLVSPTSFSTEIVELPYESVSDVHWQGGEKNFFSKQWKAQVVTNVSVPTMEVFRPLSGHGNGAAVIIAPGGGLYALSISSEGTEVASWLAAKGFTAFVLKYRLVPTGENGVQEAAQAGINILNTVKPVLPLSIADGLAAVRHVRSRAEDYDVNPGKIGFMGFSAGGAVTMGVVFNYKTISRPDFIVPIYAWMTVFGNFDVPEDAPPMLAICASDDQLGLAADSIKLLSAWLEAKKPAELHMFSKGGHGFGMRKQGIAADHWIDRFYEWSVTEGIVMPKVSSDHQL
ncbi:MAG: acetyl esterase/lipase [Oceanicoccus sp.]|jgi:acetyl esterase/lipase